MAEKRIDVRAVARLARLALTDDEVATYGAQLEELLRHVDELAQLDTADVAATAQVIESRNVDRDDVVAPCLDRDVALAGAPQPQLGYFRVPKIIAEAD
jgi:aspartyl-tRNA(Asn)/glutamyl-tRNA(Gln) amidotransferase subunit C